MAYGYSIDELQQIMYIKKLFIDDTNWHDFLNRKEKYIIKR